jgi:sulfur carrier protein
LIVTVNGRELLLGEARTVQDLVASMGARADGRGVAVAIGGEVVPRSQWQETELADGAQVEVLIAVQGG